MYNAELNWPEKIASCLKARVHVLASFTRGTQQRQLAYVTPMLHFCMITAYNVTASCYKKKTIFTNFTATT